MTTTDDRAEFTRRRNYGLKKRHANRLARWVNVDEWLEQYDRARDPHGTYSVPGRNPANYLTLKDAS